MSLQLEPAKLGKSYQELAIARLIDEYRACNKNMYAQISPAYWKTRDLFKLFSLPSASDSKSLTSWSEVASQGSNQPETYHHSSMHWPVAVWAWHFGKGWKRVANKRSLHREGRRDMMDSPRKSIEASGRMCQSCRSLIKAERRLEIARSPTWILIFKTTERCTVLEQCPRSYSVCIFNYPPSKKGPANCEEGHAHLLSFRAREPFGTLDEKKEKTTE